MVAAIAQQASMLNTHTRYLHEGILDYVEKLTGTFAPDLSMAIMTCTGSEANDIALRMAEAATGKTGVIVTDNTYHGNTSAVSQLSCSNVPKVGSQDHVRFVPAPDSYRPLGGVAGMPHAEIFAQKVEAAIIDLEKSGPGFSAILICPFFANEGFPDLPKGWLDPTEKVVRKAGGIIIADEVQPGFGRIGTDMWGHQKIGLQADIVTLGKPMANGHPVAGVVTTPALMTAFRSAYRYFNTFGGNPVSMAAAMATLQVLQEERLMENAKVVGEYAKDGLRKLATKYDFIGDVRGAGLFFGAEFVLDKMTKEPATKFANKVANKMRSEGILLSKLGIHYNTLKIRPSLQFSKENADLLLTTLDKVLSETELIQG